MSYVVGGRVGNLPPTLRGASPPNYRTCPQSGKRSGNLMSLISEE